MHHNQSPVAAAAPVVEAAVAKLSSVEFKKLLIGAIMSYEQVTIVKCTLIHEILRQILLFNVNNTL